MNRSSVARFAGAALLAAGLATTLSVPAMSAPAAGQSTGMLAAMQRDLGLTAEGALARIDQENRANAAAQALTAQLGSTLAGSWFDAATGKLVVAVTDASRVQAVHAAGATARVVSRSAAQLDAQKSSLDAAEASAPKSVTGWYVDVTTNSVVAQVLGNDPAGVAWAAAKGARTEYVAEAPRPLWNLIGGQAITTGGARCSLGFNARAGTARIVITAGHCTNIGSSWSGVGGTIGTRRGSSFPGNDYGAITVTSSAAVSTALVDRYSSGSDVTVAGSSQAGVGSSICRSGSTTGWRCGTIQAHNQTVRYPQGTVTGLTRTTACAEPGDSGGSFVSPNGATRVQAQGMTSGGSGNCSTGGIIFHQPVNEALSAFGATLVTG
ncbi:MAG TPA: S1 family peptidase [Actinophytocola sp.]|uniref:S1 family peptidase n=1 Tax=Actinophytocola sp. TaxID=1872138 RepID=UPI002DDCFE52|nr:S1 family peptidase [Actinophytocola sp.]HEV2780733.1 S1 family peptidase [Actinophytocola sp.]